MAKNPQIPNAMKTLRQQRYLSHLSWPEVEALDKQEGVVILPIGAVEQHGPHLPTITDALIVTRMLDATLDVLPDHVRAWALPPLNYGKSNEHINFPGTITLSAQTLTAVLHDIGASVHRAGFRRLALMNGHGGNTAVLEATARDIRAATGLMCFCLQPGVHGELPFAISVDEQRYGFHAGEIETSLILAMEPDLVDMEKAVKHFAHFPETDTNLFYFGAALTAWLADDWSPTGVFGDATLGTAEKGRLLLASGAQALAKLIAAMSTFEVGANQP